MYHHPSCEECREGRRSIDVNHTSQLESFICSGFRFRFRFRIPFPDSGFPGFPYALFQVSFKFFAPLSYFVKPSQEPIKQSITKVQAKFFRILTTHFSEIRQRIWVTRELLNQTALKTVLLKKQINITRAVLEYCTG